MRLAVVGATGAVGTAILGILEERRLAIDELRPVASARSAGRKLTFRREMVEVLEIAPEVFDDVDVALFDVPDEISTQWVPVAAGRGAVVIDNSAAWRMNAQVPLVVPEVNPQDADDRPLGIIASPNCTMLALVLPLAVLHRRGRVKRVIASSYQSASGAGKPGVDELWDQIQRAAKDPETVTRGAARDVLDAGTTFSHPLAMNVIPRVGSARDDGYTGEEAKVAEETRKVLGLPGLAFTATCVRVPTMVGHGVAVHAEFEEPIAADEARSLLKAAPGIEVVDDPGKGVYPTPLEAAGRDPCYVGRIRRDPTDARALEWFCVADNLRKGAALNTVQIAELVLGPRRGPDGQA
ncbi:MAG: aspartate-semialdehyde dehydrogenase [Actinomycetota bacterium]